MFFRCWRRLSCALPLRPPPLFLSSSVPAAFLAAKRVQSPQQHSRKAANLQWEAPKWSAFYCCTSISRFVAFIVCLHTWPRVAAGVLSKTNSRQDASALLQHLVCPSLCTLLRCRNTHSYEISVTNSAVCQSVLAHSKAAVKIADQLKTANSFSARSCLLIICRSDNIVLYTK